MARARAERRRPLSLGLWALLALGASACPEQAQGPSAANARTAEAEAGQVQRRLSALAQLAPGAREEEVLALADLRVWLTQRRQWRASGYRVSLLDEAGSSLERAQLEAAIAAKEPLTLELRIPAFDPPPSGRRTFADPSVLEPLLELLASGE